jgi:hypothetical protein
MAAIDVLVVPSLAEAQSIVTPQAFATGRPVIASRIGGLPELVIHEMNGLLVEPGNIDELVSAMARIANNEDTRTAMGLQARASAVASLSFSGKMDASIALYRQLTETRGRADRANGTERKIRTFPVITRPPKGVRRPQLVSLALVLITLVVSSLSSNNSSTFPLAQTTDQAILPVEHSTVVSDEEDSLNEDETPLPTADDGYAYLIG